MTKFEICNELEKLGITQVIVDYDGSGDSGQINDVVGYIKNDKVIIPDELSSKIEDLCWNYLESNYPGWEINDGAYGQFTLDVAAKKFSVAHNSVFTDSELYETEW